MAAKPLRPLLACALLSFAALAGCASAPSPVGDADAAHAGIDCEVGSVVVGFLADGAPRCAPMSATGAPALASFSCSSGKFVNGFDEEGRPRCAAPASPSPTPTTPPSPVEVSSNLKLTGLYGVRGNSSDAGLWDLNLYVELSAGAVPMDLTKLILRYSDGSSTLSYHHDPATLPDGAGPRASFNATWIRGEGANHVRRSGDLVQLHFNMGRAGYTLPTRTSVALSIIPESGTPTAADFKTPATYSTYTIVTLR